MYVVRWRIGCYLMFGTGLLVFFESSDYSGAIVGGEESGLVGEIVDHPVRYNADDYGDKTFEDENPSLERKMSESGFISRDS
jgi:hypothetical protein